MNRDVILKVTAIITLSIALFLVLNRRDSGSRGKDDETSRLLSHSPLGLEYREAHRTDRSSQRQRTDGEKHVMAIKPILGYPDPSDGYFEAWLKIQTVEKDTGIMTLDERVAELSKAYGIYMGLAREHTGWKANLVGFKLLSTRQSIISIIDAEQGNAANP